MRRLWLWSRERTNAKKLAGWKCEICGAKESKAKNAVLRLEVHHRLGVGNWDKIIEAVRAELLVSADKLQVVCLECHKKIHKK